MSWHRKLDFRALISKIFGFCSVSCQDGNGYIDEQELDALLKDLCDKNKMVMKSSPIDWSVHLVWVKYSHEMSGCLVSGRTWTPSAWWTTRRASWLWPTEGNCTGPRWRSSSAGTPRCDLPGWDLISSSCTAPFLPSLLPFFIPTSRRNLVHVWTHPPFYTTFRVKTKVLLKAQSKRWPCCFSYILLNFSFF